MWMKLIILQRKIFVLKAVNVFYRRINFHSGQWKRSTAQLQVDLLFVVAVNVYIAKRVDEIATVKVANLRYHHSEQSIRCNVERHT